MAGGVSQAAGTSHAQQTHESRPEDGQKKTGFAAKIKRFCNDQKIPLTTAGVGLGLMAFGGTLTIGSGGLLAPIGAGLAIGGGALFLTGIVVAAVQQYRGKVDTPGWGIPDLIRARKNEARAAQENNGADVTRRDRSDSSASSSNTREERRPRSETPSRRSESQRSKTRSRSESRDRTHRSNSRDRSRSPSRTDRADRRDRSPSPASPSSSTPSEPLYSTVIKNKFAVEEGKQRRGDKFGYYNVTDPNQKGTTSDNSKDKKTTPDDRQSKLMRIQTELRASFKTDGKSPTSPLVFKNPMAQDAPSRTTPPGSRKNSTASSSSSDSAPALPPRDLTMEDSL